MIWGYAGVFPGEFRLWDGDEFRNKYRFLREHGFAATGIGLSEAVLPERRAYLGGDETAAGVVHSVHVGLDVFGGGGDEWRGQVAWVLDQLAECKDAVRARVLVVNPGPYHRYMREPSLTVQMQRLGEALTPLVAGAAALGVPVALENHCDYLVDDLAGLCAGVPGLGLFWDTGNGIMTGEHPVLTAERAVTLMVGCHFKDFSVMPDEKSLTLRLTGAALGEGDMELERLCGLIERQHPRPESLLMEFELVPEPGKDPWISLHRSKKFVERISGWKFRYPEEEK